MIEVIAAQAGTILTLALSAPDQGYGPWGTIVNILQGLIIGAGGLGIVVGIAVKAVAIGNADRQELGNRILERAIFGTFLGFLAGPLYNLIVQWTS